MARATGRASSGVSTPRSVAKQILGNAAERQKSHRTNGGDKQVVKINGRLEPDREQLKTFIEVLFKHAGTEGYVSIRSFYDDDSTKAYSIKTVWLAKGLNGVVEVAVREARKAANAKELVVFSPPIAVLNDTEERWHAREIDLLLGPALSVECDKHAQQAREKLEQLLGPVTVVVASGGEWIDPETGEVQPKLHLHWRLRKPAEGQAALKDLKDARDIATRLVGSDPSNIPMVHPIRWPGSWHRKREPKLCHIVALNDDAEIDLATALGVLKKVAPHGEVEQKKKTAADYVEEYGQEGQPNWGKLIEQVLSAESYHEPLVRLAAKLIKSGMSDGAAVNMLKGLMQASAGPHDERWQARYNDIDRAVSTAQDKYGQQEEAGNTNEQKPSVPAIDPVDLWAQSRVPPLPRGVLPKIIETYALAQGKLMGADPAGLAMAALTVCAAAIPDRVKLQPKKNEPWWLISTRIWCALVGGVSAMKSPIMRQCMRVIERIDAELRRKFAQAMAAYEALPNDQKKKAEEPILERIRVDDVTPESAQEIFKDNHEGIFLSVDELSGFFGSMDKYAGPKGARADRGFWLKAFNGGSHSVDRIGRGSYMIENLSISVLGGTQPDTARRMFADGVDDGLLQRINPIMVRNGVLGSEEELRSPPGEPYECLVEQLYRLRHRHEGPIQFDAEAAVIRRQLEEKHLKLVNTFEVINRKLAAHVGKYNGMFASFCLLWHTIKTIDEKWQTNIDADTARKVATFMHDFLLPHAIAFYRNTFGLANDHDRLTAVAGYILAHKLERLNNRDIQRGVRTLRDLDRRDIESVFNQLDTFGWVTRVQGRKFTDLPTWIVNPSVHEKFKEHAEWEVDQRQQAQLLMAETIAKHEVGASEIARHSSGYVLSAHQGKLEPPKLLLKLVRPGPVKKRLGESGRIWLKWDSDTRELDLPSSTKLAGEPEEIQDWLADVLRGEAMPA